MPYLLDQTSARIRVLIVDDQFIVRMALKLYLLAFDDLEWVGEADNSEQALQLCDRIKPDVVLIDLDTFGLDGFSASRAINQCCPWIKVIALVGFKNEEVMRRAQQVGVFNYLNKDISAARLADAIRVVHQGF